MHRTARAVLVALALVLTASLAAWCHRPVTIGGAYATPEDALRITEIDVSQVAYSALSDADPALWLAFEAQAGTDLFVSLGLPVLDRLASYRPSIAVIGPGLPEIDVSLEIPETAGGIVLSTAEIETPRFFHEPVTGTESWILVDRTIQLPEDGTYYVIAWSPSQPPDKLWVAVGRKERYGLQDVLGLPAIVRDVRTFHEVPPRHPGWATLAKLLFLGLSAGLIAWLATH